MREESKMSKELDTKGKKSSGAKKGSKTSGKKRLQKERKSADRRR